MTKRNIAAGQARSVTRGRASPSKGRPTAPNPARAEPPPHPAADRPARARRKSPRGDESRRVILESAFKLFSASGFNSASLADIAADVGMTQAGLLHHFPSKGALLLAVLQEREERNERDEELGRKSGLDYLSAFLRTLGTNEQYPAIVQLFAVLSAESITDGHPAHSWFVARYRKIVAAATRAMREIIDESKLPDGATAETVARWVIAMADGLRLQWLLDPPALKRTEVMAQMFELLRPYLRDTEMPISWTKRSWRKTPRRVKAERQEKTT